MKKRKNNNATYLALDKLYCYDTRQSPHLGVFDEMFPLTCRVTVIRVFDVDLWKKIENQTIHVRKILTKSRKKKKSSNVSARFFPIYILFHGKAHGHRVYRLFNKQKRTAHKTIIFCKRFSATTLQRFIPISKSS